MKRAILLISLCVIIALIDAPIYVSDDIQKSILPETITADYVYIYEYDGKIKTSCRSGEYDMPQVGAWYALEDETYVVTNARLMWCDGMKNDDVVVSVYCEKLQNYLTKRYFMYILFYVEKIKNIYHGTPPMYSTASYYAAHTRRAGKVNGRGHFLCA